MVAPTWCTQRTPSFSSEYDITIIRACFYFHQNTLLLSSEHISFVIREHFYCHYSASFLLLEYAVNIFRMHHHFIRSCCHFHQSASLSSSDYAAIFIRAWWCCHYSVLFLSSERIDIAIRAFYYFCKSMLLLISCDTWDGAYLHEVHRLGYSCYDRCYYCVLLTIEHAVYIVIAIWWCFYSVPPHQTVCLDCGEDYRSCAESTMLFMLLSYYLLHKKCCQYRFLTSKQVDSLWFCKSIDSTFPLSNSCDGEFSKCLSIKAINQLHVENCVYIWWRLKTDEN